MKVKLNQIYAGPRGCAQPGQMIDVPADEAKALIDQGYATAVDPLPAKAPIETAEAERSVETAVSQSRRKKPGRRPGSASSEDA